MIENTDTHAVERLLAALEDGPEVENYSISEIYNLPIEAVRTRLKELGIDPTVPDETIALLHNRATPAQELMSALEDLDMDDNGIGSMDIKKVYAELHQSGLSYRNGINRLRELLGKVPPDDGESELSLASAAPTTDVPPILRYVARDLSSKSMSTNTPRISSSVSKGMHHLTGSARILLVDSDAQAAATIQSALKANASVLEHVTTGEEAFQLAKRYDFDAMILDLMLPDIDGYELIRRLRWTSVAVPILVLSSHARPQAKVKAFSLGADDFLARPFDESELGARIQALVRRSKGFSHSKIVVGRIVLDMDSNIVTVNGNTIHLTEKEYRILEILFLRGGCIVAKESFLNHLYGGNDEPNIKIINVFVRKLQRKLALAGAGDVITTVRGRGYVVRDARAGQTTTQSEDTVAPHVVVSASVA